MANRRPSPLETAAWAAYVLGYDIHWLLKWNWGMWSARNEARAGKFSFNMELPAAAMELETAAKILASRNDISASDAYQMGVCLERWRHDMDLMLIEFVHPESTSFYDEWDQTPFPSLAWREFSEIASRACKAKEHLRGWFEVGELMLLKDDFWTIWVKDGSKRELRRFQELARHLEIKALCDLAHYLLFYSPANRWRPPEELASIIDPLRQQPTPRRIEALLRKTLKEGVAPEPWIVLTPARVYFLGQEFATKDIPPRQKALLWLLCEKPKSPVTRTEVIQATKHRTEGYKTKDVIVAASRLRNTLRGAAEEFIQKQGWSKEHEDYAIAKKCFIMPGLRSEDYQLEIDSFRVVVEGERPNSMNPRSRKRTCD